MESDQTYPVRRTLGLASDSPIVRVVGLFLVLPALIALAFGYVSPTAETVTDSFREIRPFPGESRSVGSDNYDALPDIFGSSIGFALSLSLLPLATVLIVAPAVAYLAHRAGRAARWTAWLVLAVPVVVYSPVAFAAATLLEEAGPDNPFADPDAAGAEMRSTIWLTLFGVITGLAVFAYLITFRRYSSVRSALPAVLTVGGLAALAVVAMSLQAFTYPFVITRGGPADQTQTPVALIYHEAFVQGQFGMGAAISTILIAILAALGLVAALVIIASRLRVGTIAGSADRSVGESRHGVGWLIGAVLAVVIMVGVAIYGLVPWLKNLSGGEEIGSGVDDLLSNTWSPPGLPTVVGVLLAAIAGFGIAVLRPFGRFSELLLLPFAPWLFVGSATLMVSRWQDLQGGEALGTVDGLRPQAWLVVPALFVFTVFFRGQRAASSVTMVARALPLAGLVVVATWIWRAQDLAWQVVVSVGSEVVTAPVAALVTLSELTVSDVDLSPLLPIWIVAIGAVMVAMAGPMYLDRLDVQVGRVDDETNPVERERESVS